MHEQTIASFAGPPFSDLCHIKEENWRNEEKNKEATKKKEINSMFPMISAGKWFGCDPVVTGAWCPA